MKKTLITANDIKKTSEQSDKTLYVEPGTIVTPAARDAASELEVTIIVGTAPSCEQAQCSAPAVTPQAVAQPAASAGGLDPELIAKIVEQVIASMAPAKPVVQEPIKISAPGGLRVVKGNSVVMEKFDTGKPEDKVGIKDLLTLQESPNMAAGIMTLEEVSFPWELNYDEVEYIMEGYMDMIVDGVPYRAEAGDVLYIPMHSKVIFSCPEKVKFLYVTYPANWQSLSN